VCPFYREKVILANNEKLVLWRGIAMLTSFERNVGHKIKKQASNIDNAKFIATQQEELQRI
jgi:hypothetical protein